MFFDTKIQFSAHLVADFLRCLSLFSPKEWVTCYQNPFFYLFGNTFEKKNTILKQKTFNLLLKSDTKI